MAIQLADATITVNNETIGVVPNSIKYTEGDGEQKVHAVSIGGGATEQVFANDVESNYSMVSFDLRSTVDNIRLAKDWKVRGNGNTISLQGENEDGNVVRNFASAALTQNYEVEIGVDSVISLEFQSNSAK